MRELFPSGAVLLSVDTEHMWGYFDHLSEDMFCRRFPGAADGQDRLLKKLIEARMSATWFVVGGMALQECAGANDPRVAGLPERWIRRIPPGREAPDSLWYRPSFLLRLRDAGTFQEIGLHGGLTHLVWTDPRVTSRSAMRELVEGVRALEELGICPHTFSFARTQEAYPDLLSANDLHSYRGRVPALAWRLGRSISGAVLRALDEWRSTDPPIVWPRETFPGLWNIPASMFFYPIRAARTSIAPVQSRVKRFVKGVEGAVRAKAIFHFSLHPENLVESPQAFPVFDEILEHLARAREEDGVEILTMSDVACRMERNLLCSTKTVTPATT